MICYAKDKVEAHAKMLDGLINYEKDSYGNKLPVDRTGLIDELGMDPKDIEEVDEDEENEIDTDYYYHD